MSRPPASTPVRQVYAYVVRDDGRVLIQDDDGRFNLPGGKPEPSDADEIATLRRECLEESQVAIHDESYLGYVEVQATGTNEKYAQLRYLARLKELLPVACDPATGRAYGRLFVPLEEVSSRLGWGDNGAEQIATLKTVIKGA